ncbi:efflux RND transporter periplasmic adaptor subunit [Inhella sp.]|uniref:efflux RND transporter periplasmic adaptor subunit n=1 Tax=Inhella sp. TaxID=1921806 RepID=UPI0035AE40F4
MKTQALALALLAALSLNAQAQQAAQPAQPAPAGAPKPALNVKLVAAQSQNWPQTLSATGNLAAWQEVAVGSETGGLRLVKVEAQVGDAVKKGQLLAQLASETLEAELAATRAGLREAEVAARDAAAQAARVQALAGGDAVSAQQVEQLQASAAAAAARLESLKAQLRAAEVRLSHTRVLAPDDGVIAAREALPGAMAQPGQELFRLIRQGRLEWRAEVPAPELAQLKPGQAVTLTPVGGQPLEGRVRVVAPKVDPATRNGLVYVDLLKPGAARAGMFARGEFQLQSGTVIALPQSAVLLRNGFAYVFQVDKEMRVRQRKVELGRRVGEAVEIKAGLKAGESVVAQGLGFLADGDLVKVVK